jgi:hypothetical protein
MSIYDDVLGTKLPGATEGQKDPKYSHWCNPSPSGGTPGLGTMSADKNAFMGNRAGMKGVGLGGRGQENPHVPIVEQERGDPKRDTVPAEAKPDWFTSCFKED